MAQSRGGRGSAWLALVGKELEPRRTRHTWGSDLMPWPAVLILEVGARTGNCMLYRYAADGTFAGDTWAETQEEAFTQAAWEYEGSLGSWQEIPSTEEPIGYAIAWLKSRGS
jgi:hypothetical protein